MLKFSKKLLTSQLAKKSQFAFRYSASLQKPQQTQEINPYVSQMYDYWKADPQSVDPQWNQYFQETLEQKDDKANKLDQDFVLEQTELNMLAYVCVKRYLQKGHELANLDPLNLKEVYGQRKEFGKKYSSTSIKDSLPQLDGQLDKPFIIENGEHLSEVAFFLREKSNWTLREILDKLEKIYCRHVGFEYSHIENPKKKAWLQEHVEKFQLNDIPVETKLKTLRNLAKNDALNNFFKSKFSTTKRFGIEGCDAMISGLETIVDTSVENGIENIVIGMPHRGRMNTLACVLGKPMVEIFAEFQDKKLWVGNEDGWGGAGDVKYHLGVTHDKYYPDNKKINLRILPNPSHLEAVNPCVYGTTRSIQDDSEDFERSKSMGILVHGDSAFSGQGVVYESLQMGDLKGYTSGGLIHIIVNNQIGFTTTPAEFRSGYHCTELAKVVEAPIFHVNADHPELVDGIMKMAVEYRQQFKSDVFIDIVGYRRYGHNELDQPLFTQPMMYRQIQLHPPVMDLYLKHMINMGLMTEQKFREIVADFTQEYEEAYQTSKGDKFVSSEWEMKAWEQVKAPHTFGVIKNTNLPMQILKDLGRSLSSIPEDFKCHNLIKKIFNTRLQSFETGKNIDMASAEALAFGSLLTEGYGIRLSGQDVERGTFSQRHSKIVNQEDESQYIPFHQVMNQEQIRKQQFTVVNSSLSEFGVLGFEYGYSITNPNILTIWEAQFGDFCNGAQVMIDNFISTGETKWGIQTGLVINLPHGMDGLGAEHSSGRLERFLSLCDDDITAVKPDRATKLKRQVRHANMQIVYPSTSVNYFHALRRQMRRDFRKPLVVFSSKKLLRYKRASSDLEEFENQIRFATVYGESYPQDLVPEDQIKKVVICAGQVYYDLLEKREELQRKDVALIRLEQLCPFPYDYLKQVINGYKNASFVWCQEEQRNNGGWEYVEPRIDLILGELFNEGNTTERQYVYYTGRKVSGSTATGSTKVHALELEAFLKDIYEK